MGSIYRRNDSPFWWIAYTNANKKRVRESTQTEERAVAKQILAEREIEVWNQRHRKEKPKRLWEEAVLMYLSTTSMKSTTSINLKYTLEWLDHYLKGRPLHLISRQEIEQIAIYKEQEGCSAVTINTVLRKIRVILRKACYEWEWIDHVPKIRFRKEPPPRMRWEPPEVMQKVLKSCNEHQRKAIIFALCTGLRKTNIAQLQKAWIDREHRMLTIPGDYYKNGNPHSIPLNQVAMAIINDEWEKHEKYLFTYQGKPIRDLGTKSWRNALKKAGVTDFRWHDLRHTWTSWMIQNGESLHTIKELGGWRKMDSMLRYAHLAKAHLSDASNRLNDTKLSRLIEGEKKKDEISD